MGHVLNIIFVVIVLTLCVTRQYTLLQTTEILAALTLEVCLTFLIKKTFLRPRMRQSSQMIMIPLSFKLTLPGNDISLFF